MPYKPAQDQPVTTYLLRGMDLGESVAAPAAAAFSRAFCTILAPKLTSLLSRERALRPPVRVPLVLRKKHDIVTASQTR